MFNKFEDYVQQPTYKNKLEVYSDGNDDYTTVLPEYFHKDSICYGQHIKSLGIRRKVFGNPSLENISTNNNECFNAILRGRLSRIVRRSNGHAKNKYHLNNALFLFQFYWNFMHELHKNVTPAILEKQSTKVWTWGNFLHAKLTFVD